MAIAPLQIPQANINSSYDFSPLANLGEVYKKAQNQQKLSDLGKQLAAGNVDYRSAAGQLAEMGDTGSMLKFLALAEQQRKEGLARQFSADFMGNVFNPPGAAQTIAPAPSTKVNPAPGLVPNAADDEEAPQARAPVASTPTVVGDAEGMARGLYPGPSATPLPAARPDQPLSQPLSFAQRFDAARPTGVAPAAVPAPVAPAPPPAAAAAADATPTAQLRTMPQARSYVGAMLSPDASEDQKKFAQEMLKRELDNAKPNERIQFLDDLAKGTQYEGRPDGRLQLELALRKSGATTIDQRTEAAAKTEGAKVLTKRFDELSQQGQAAKEDLSTVEQLRDLRQTFKTGGKAALQGKALEYGIPLGKSTDEIGAYSALIKKATPLQRPPGSGATSNYEERLYMGSLPALINQPGGNDIIDATMTAKAEYRMEVARIADLALANEISHKEALQKMRELPSPYKRFMEFKQRGFKMGPEDAAAPPTSQPSQAPQTSQAPAAEAPRTPDEVSQSIANARAKIARNPGARDAVLRQLQNAGLPTDGL